MKIHMNLNYFRSIMNDYRPISNLKLNNLIHMLSFRSNLEIVKTSS